MALWVVLVCITVVTCQNHDFDMSSCRMTMSCGGPTAGDDNEFANIRRQISALTPTKKCHQTKFRFPNAKQATDYIRIKSPIPDMSELTVCTWLTPASTSVLNECALVSYATSQFDNSFLIYYKSTSKFELWINGEIKTIVFPTLYGRNHLCVTVKRTSGWAKVYTNGVLRGTITYTKTNPIVGGGAYLIGQEQDAVLSGLDSNQAFSGTIENFTTWYRVLNDSEISNIHRDPCSCPTDYTMSLSSVEIQLEGKVLAKPTAEC